MLNSTKQELSRLSSFAEPDYPVIVLEQASIVLFLTESRSQLFNFRINLKLLGKFCWFIPTESVVGY